MKVIQGNASAPLRLSANFTLAEFLVSDTAKARGIDNTPNPLQQANLYQCALLMEAVRKVLGDRPILISSGFRSVALNAAVGGARKSDHLNGSAIDFCCPAFGTPLEVARAIAKSDRVIFGQLIHEQTWVHISLPTAERKGELLTARFGRGGTTYERGLNA